MNNQYIGVMSGTSLDGVDVIWSAISPEGIKELGALEYSFPKELKSKILEAIKSPLSLRELGIIDHELAQLFSSAVRALLKKYNIDTHAISAIGLHGQTLWHQPTGEAPFSMQLGDPNIVCAQTAIDVVADFRRMDLAHGGQGAPFAPAFHQEVFKDLADKSAVLNLGGIANITLLGTPLSGFDIGPANVLLDYWADKYLGKSYDKDGAWGLSGKVNEKLLERFLQEPYFALSAPKSTGRELFNGQWLETILLEFSNIEPVDVQCTLLQLSAKTVADVCEKEKIKTLILCGGGAKNSALIRYMQALLPRLEIQTSDEYGVNSDTMEALAFAWLAYKRVQKEPVQLSSVTGAKQDSILGALYASS